MTARSQCDHWDCPVVSDFKAWLFLSLPQNASLSPWETLDFSGIAPLLLIGAKQKVDGFNFQDFEVPAICSFNDPVSDLFEGNVVLYELQTGGCFLPTAWAFAPTGVSCV